MFVNVRPRVSTLLETTPTTVHALTNRDQANLLCVRAGSLCRMNALLRLTETQLVLLEACALEGTAPPEELARGAHPRPYQWLEEQGLPLTLANMRTYWREHHHNDVTPYRRCEVFCRLGLEGETKLWRVRTLNDHIILMVRNCYDLLIPKDRCGNYVDIDVHCTTSGKAVAGGIIFDVVD